MNADFGEQRQYMDKLREEFRGGTYHIVTYGCQMNARESETLAGMLCEMGLTETGERHGADVLLFNTCCVRENAEKRTFGNIGRLREVKRLRPLMRVGVCGCMMQQDGVAERFLRRYPFVDFVIGTQGTHRLPAILYQSLKGRQNAVIDDESIAEGLPVKREKPYYASVSVMFGCDNFCSYCIVPHVRGRERSRDVSAIIREAENLASDGVKEIMLLGQNVNSFNGGMRFPELLKRLDGIVPRIRFMTSHPKDCSEELLQAMASGDSVLKQLHLPAQSGSDDVLKKMNRGYASGHYLSLIEKAREIMPEIGLSTDLIVGFPGETEEDFQATLRLIEQARFHSAYMFAFSPRSGTPAEKMENQIPLEIREERLARLIARMEILTGEALQSLVGKTDNVLIDGTARHGEGFTGRTDRGVTVNVKGNAALGEIRKIRYIGTARSTAKGELIDEHGAF